MNTSERIYIGSYKGQSTYCLHVCNYDSQNGSITKLNSCEIDNSSYLCLSPDRRCLYTVIEQDNYKGRPGGGIAAFGVENDGKLRFLNDSYTEGEHPCHLSVSADGKTLYAANYSGGSTIYFDLLATGEIGEKKVFVNHRDFGAASNAFERRQESPHAHYVQPVTVGGISTIWVCDLGLDAVLILDEAGKELTRFQAPAGFGPRHLAFHPTLPYAYLLGELACAVITLEYSFDTALKLGSYLPVSVFGGFAENTTSAAIRVSPDCKHLLVSNRVHGEEGTISILNLYKGIAAGVKSLVPSGGCWPRDFAFTPAGDRVLVANEHSDRVSVFDWCEGSLTHTGIDFHVQKPACILM